MKHSAWIRLACVALATCLLPTAGCSPQSGNDVSLVFSDDDGPLVPFEETVTLTQVKSHNPNITYIEGESKSDNFVTRFYKEKLNVVWETKWDADPAAYTAKLNLDIASDELPDVCLVSASQLNGAGGGGSGHGSDHSLQQIRWRQAQEKHHHEWGQRSVVLYIRWQNVWHPRHNEHGIRCADHVDAQRLARPVGHLSPHHL